MKSFLLADEASTTKGKHKKAAATSTAGPSIYERKHQHRGRQLAKVKIK